MTGKKPVLGVIIGNRGFFPDHLADTGRQEIQRILEAEGITPIMLTPQDSNFGSLETMADADKCAALFKAHREEIIGVLISLPNFGEERPIAAALRLSGLDVPVLVQATPDEPGKMTIADRRDSFCGKMSTCSNLTQHGIPFSLTRSHTVSPSSTEFLEDLRWFVSVCQVVAGLRGARIGCLGARPAAFTTVRYSEKLLEQAGITYAMPRGAFYFFPEAPGGDDLAFVNRLLAENILAVPGRGFGCPGHFRLSFSVETDVIERSADGFARAARSFT